MPQDANRLILYPSRLKVMALAVGSLAIAALGAGVLAFRGQMEMPLVPAAIVAACFVPFGSVCAAYATYRLLVRRPALVIDKDGIVDNASAVGVGFLAWAEIQHVVIYSYARHKMLGIVPSDPHALYARIGPIKSRLLRWNLRLGATSINIPQMTLPLKLEDLIPILEKHCRVMRDALVPESLSVVNVSDSGVSCLRPDGAAESLKWDDLQRVEILTTDAGPFAPDVFWVLHGSETGCVVPQGATGESTLLRRLQSLPGFSNEAVMQAMASTTNQEFLCWQRTTSNA
jgi:hypothetical protein